jgi:hypothetical protein
LALSLTDRLSVAHTDVLVELVERARDPIRGRYRIC